MMAVFSSRPSTTVLLLSFFFFLLMTTTRICSPLACPAHPPSCDPSIDIRYPFYMDQPGCNNGIYQVQCIDGASKAMIEPKGRFFTVKEIDYQNKRIKVEDEQFTREHPDVACSFLYNFTRPIPHFDGSYSSIIDNSIYNCQRGKEKFSLLNRTYNYSVGRDFRFYYCDGSSPGKDDPAWVLQSLPPTCEAQKIPLLELKLSFSTAAPAAPDGQAMSLLSAAVCSNPGQVLPSTSRSLLLEGVDGVVSILYGMTAGNLNVSYPFRKSAMPKSSVATPAGFKVSCSSNKKHTKIKKKTAIDIVGGAVALVTASCFVICCYYRIYRKKSLNNDQNVENFLKIHGSLAPKRYKYSDVKKITESFRNKLGQGGYGSVFKGTLIDGRLVAVKVLSDSKGNGEDFFNEIAGIGRSSHVNIVNLLGFCSEGSKRVLIYEYMCNGSLDKLICSEEPKTTLQWEKLYQIATGIARGLEYLHRGCNTRIVHFDIKPHNILLDKDFRPKISDFGLSKLCLRNDSILSMEGTRGTIGYIAPEVFCRNFGVVSSKSDIYSYGMMVLEMAGGRENKPLDVQNTSENYFPYSIYKHLYHSGGLEAYGATAETEEVVRKMILVGLWCIQTVPQNRPSITKVIEMLEGSIDDLQVPPKPNLSFPSFGPVMDISSCSNDDCSSAVR